MFTLQVKSEAALSERESLGGPSRLWAEQGRHFVIDAARLCHDRHCEEVLLFDLRGLSDICDYLLIASGTSDRQIEAVRSEIAHLANDRGLERFGPHRDTGTTWAVLDLVDVVVHLFEPATRAHYDLEMMWDDAPRLSWQRHLGK